VPEPSIVIDPNATVKKSRWGVIVAVVVVLAFVAFSVVWFATRDSSDGYKAGPAAQALLDSMHSADINVPLSGKELKCIDELYAGVDLALLRDQTFDPMNSDDPELAALGGKLFDDCLERQTRIDILAAGMTQDESATAEQKQCAGKVVDDAILGAGGYVALMADDSAFSTIVMGLFASLAGCGLDLFGATDDSTYETVDFSGCDTDYTVATTALDAYRADHDKNPTSWDDLYPDYVTTDLSDRFTVEGGSDGSVTLTGIGDCEGYSYSIGA
jgi:hypothetical protein